jgi:hypothetical protein
VIVAPIIDTLNIGFVKRVDPSGASKMEKITEIEIFSKPKAKETAVTKTGYVLIIRTATENGMV